MPAPLRAGGLEGVGDLESGARRLGEVRVRGNGGDTAAADRLRLAIQLPICAHKIRHKSPYKNDFGASLAHPRKPSVTVS